MNALIRKEARSILPLWIAAMLLAILPVWTLWPGPQGVMFESLSWLVFAPFGLGVLLLSLAPLGQELNWGTLPVLLSQPVTRDRVWRVKVGVLAVALGCAFIAFCVSNLFRVDSMIETMKSTVWRNAFSHPGAPNSYFVKLIADTRRTASLDTLLIGGLEVLAGFTGGLWTTLLCRQVTAAFWLTFVAPMGLALVTGKALGSLPASIGEAGLFIVLGAYSAVGFVWAKRMFLQAQDTQWTGGVVSLPAWRTDAASAGGSRKRKPLLALLGKELQAQYINLLLAGGLLLLHLGVLVFRKYSAGYLASHRSMEMSLEAFPVLWLAMPLLIGSISVAEERKLGVLESSLCLPASRRFQFTTKFVLAILLGNFLGGIVPLTIEHWAGSKLTGNQTGLYFLGSNMGLGFVQLAGAFGLSGLAFYGSTLTRNTLQAMGAGLSAGVAACLIIAAFQFVSYSPYSPEIIPWRGPLIGLIGWPVMLICVVALAYRNYRWLQPGLKTWGRNIFTLLAALLCVAVVTTTLYHRAWEAWLPEEPRHSFFPMQGLHQGPKVNFNPGGVVSVGEGKPKLVSSPFRTAVILPNGQLWLKEQWVRLVRRFNKTEGVVVSVKTGRSYEGFLPEGKWKDVAVGHVSCFAIRADGTLWDLSYVQDGQPVPKQVGSDKGWRMISGGFAHFCALKSDGSLWQWGRFASNGTETFSTSNSEDVEPQRVGTDTDWTAVCDSGLAGVAIKTDGDIWRWGRILGKQPEGAKYHWVWGPERWLASSCTMPVSMDCSGFCIGIVCEDGTLWIGGSLADSFYRQFVEPGEAQRASREMVRLGKASDWSQFEFTGWRGAVGIKRDGSLYEWNLFETFQPWTGWILSPTRPSFYHDWMAAARFDDAYLALARDGNLCLWGDRNGGNSHDPNGPDPQQLLMPSRLKARRIANLSR